jgi:hypothetical protein
MEERGRRVKQLPWRRVRSRLSRLSIGAVAMPGQNYDVLLLRPDEITDVIDMAQAIDLVEQGYREAQEFPIINAPRRRVHSRNNVRISSFPGGVDGLGVIGSLTGASRSCTTLQVSNIRTANIRSICCRTRRRRGCNAS